MPAIIDALTDTVSYTYVTALVVAVASYVLFYRWQLVKTHPDEPPIIPSAIPFVGHPLGMVLQGGRYVKNLGLCNPDKPIFTLPVPGSRMYIVTDPSLAAAVQRASKTLSFTPLVPDITRRVLGLDDETVAVVRQHIDPEPGEPRGFLADIHDLVYSYLGPGEALHELSLGAIQELARRVEDYAERVQKERKGVETVDLLQWIRHFVAVATANFLYGDENPLALHPELESSFWDFDHGLGSLLMGVLPSLTAPKAYRGREALAAAFEEYLSKGRHLPGNGRKGASVIVQKRVTIALQHGWTLQAAARSELSFLFAGIVNTATTTFWMVLHLFASPTSSTPNLLSTIRSELSTSFTPDPHTGTLTLSLDSLKASSPTLQSLLRECLRQNSDTYSTRLVKSPTTLSGPSGPYHLAADAIVQISGGTIHADPRIWGPDSAVFNPLRFLPPRRSRQKKHHHHHHGDDDPAKEEEEAPHVGTTTTANAATNTNDSSSNSNSKNNITNPSHTSEGNNNKNIHPAAFRAFGGGKTLCPGRHFATASIQALVAMLVMGFDITAAADNDADSDGDGDSDSDDGESNAREEEEEEEGQKQQQQQNQKGELQVPGKEDGVLPVHVLEPKGRVVVMVRVRDLRFIAKVRVV